MKDKGSFLRMHETQDCSSDEMVLIPDNGWVFVMVQNPLKTVDHASIICINEQKLTVALHKNQTYSIVIDRNIFETFSIFLRFF